MGKINHFKNEYFFLSNFYPVQIVIDNITYGSVEHAYVAMKTLDVEIRKKISQIDRPSGVKKFGRTIQLRSDWDHVKLPLMMGLLCIKFQNPELKLMLKSTGSDYLEEGNWWGDTFWGVCRGIGENNLGKLLMEIRSQI